MMTFNKRDERRFNIERKANKNKREEMVNALEERVTVSTSDQVQATRSKLSSSPS